MKSIKIILIIVVVTATALGAGGVYTSGIVKAPQFFIFSSIEDLWKTENSQVTDKDELLKSSENTKNTPTFIATPSPEPYTEIVLGAAGDIMAHIRQINDAHDATGGEGYSFYHWFEYIKPALEYPDLMIANLEGPIAGDESGYNGYPRFNFPDEIVDAIKYSGIDVVLNANNHVLDRDVEGIVRTMDILDEAKIYHTGAWKSAKDKEIPLIIDVNGIKVGIVSCTYSLNGLEQHLNPEVLEYLVCYTELEQVEKRINLCREYGAEVVVVCPHMGDEFQNSPRKGIRDYAESYIKMGADIVFACHPHVVQPVVEYETELGDGTPHKGIIFYSLGNFVSGMYGVDTEAGMIGYVNVKRNNSTGEITLESYSYLPTYTLRHGQSGNLYHILPLGQCLDFPEMYEALDITYSVEKRMKSAWDLTVSVVGQEPADLLRYIPD